MRQYQKAALGPRLLEGDSQHCVDQLLEDDFAGDRLRHLDDGGEVEMFDGRLDRACRNRCWFVVPQVWKELIELPNLAVSPPAEIAASGILQVERSNLIEPAPAIEGGSALIRDRFVVRERVRMGQSGWPVRRGARHPVRGCPSAQSPR